MKRGKEAGQEKAKLPESLDKRLAAYALAATAMAGMGMMCAATPAMAGNITVYTPSPPFQVGPGAGYKAFSSQGVPLLGFSIHKPANSLLAGYANSVSFNPAVMLAPHSGVGGEILRLSAGAPIGKSGNFGPFGYMVSGFWSGGGLGFVGLSFLKNGNAYFGWAKVSVAIGASGISAKVFEVAVDNIPDQTIDAGETSTVPEPGTLSLLALGAVGLLALRKRRQAIRG